MILVVGLGNPTNEYKNTRHNIGFMVIDNIISSNDCINLSSSKFKGELYKFQNFLFLKPLTFMNSSGQSVISVMNFYKPDKVVVIHDDIDLKFGAIKFKFGGSSGGHNGLKSIDEFIGSDYFRVRIGVGRDKNVISYVLSNFNDEQNKSLDALIAKASEAVMEFDNKTLNEISTIYSQKGIE